MADAYEAWLRSRGVWWSDKVRLVAPGDECEHRVIHGWGVVATAAVRRGEVLFRIPRRACFGARARSRDDERAHEVDSQARLARLILAERAKGARSRWLEHLRVLPDDVPTPWRWSAARQRWLASSELELPLRAKLARLRAEYEKACATGASRGATFDEWCALCAVVISHVNPWFGGCIVPFVCTLNAPDVPSGQRPTVAYERAEGGRAIVGAALAPLAPGDECTQSYGEGLTVADLIYRYGFCFESLLGPRAPSAPRPADVVSVSAAELRAFVEAVADGSWLRAVGASAALYAPRARAHAPARAAADAAADAALSAELRALQASAERALHSFAERIALLRAACVLQPSPWDGLGDTLTLELGLAEDDRGERPPTARTPPGHAPSPPRGLAELVAACSALLLLQDSDWACVDSYASCAARARGPPSEGSALDGEDLAAIGLCSALEALAQAEWPPAAQWHAASQRVQHARAQAGGQRADQERADGASDVDDEDASDDDDDDEGEEEEDDDEPLWEALIPLAHGPWGSARSWRATQLAMDWLRWRKMRHTPLVGEEYSQEAHMADCLHTIEHTVLRHAAAVVDWHVALSHAHIS